MMVIWRTGMVHPGFSMVVHSHVPVAITITVTVHMFHS
jgi:hypothetical protein